jgi:hypothetical protein
MARLCWRLLAAFALILFAAALRAQNPGSVVPVIKQEFHPYDVALPRVSPIPPADAAVSRLPVGVRPPIPGSFAFPQIVQIAGIIFSGHVTAVGHGSSPGPASTTVSFQVEQAIRGVSAGQTLTIREWAGLWTTGERYRVGEHVFLFLYPPSKLGLTSPVAGSMGRFAVDFRNMVVLTPQHIAALLPDPVLGGRTFIFYKDFALAIQRFGGRE